MSDRHSVIPRTMCLVFYKDEVLMINAANKDWAGLYDPVGGHLEKGEDIIAGAKREIGEETGLTDMETQLVGVVHVNNFYGKQIMMFVTKSIAKTKKVTPSDEGELEWIKLDELDKVKTLPDVVQIIEKVMAMDEGEIFVGVSEFDDNNELVSLEFN